jgi:hypothetical protein
MWLLDKIFKKKNEKEGLPEETKEHRWETLWAPKESLRFFCGDCSKKEYCPQAKGETYDKMPQVIGHIHCWGEKNCTNCKNKEFTWTICNHCYWNPKIAGLD